jgi:hypothetical protein
MPVANPISIHTVDATPDHRCTDRGACLRQNSLVGRNPNLWGDGDGYAIGATGRQLT